MKPPTRIPLRLASRLAASKTTTTSIRPIHTTLARTANVAPIVGTGPPPEAPSEASGGFLRVERRRRQAELLKNLKEYRTKDGKKAILKKRFWTDVEVREVNGALQIHLDERPLRHPKTKEIIRVPVTKPNLAAALAIEWDSMTSTQEATRQHLIPLTSLVCRAIDIMVDEQQIEASNPSSIRSKIIATVMPYLDTDSLLCWAPPAGPYDLKNEAGQSLREVQQETMEPIVSFLTTSTWPGTSIRPVLDGHSLFPQSQAEGVREIVQGWVTGLDAWELTGLERAVLASKSLITAARLVSEWSEGGARSNLAEIGTARPFGAEEAAKASSLELDWQAMQWGEVDDTHDVNHEDLRRQLASVVLLVSGSGRP